MCRFQDTGARRRTGHYQGATADRDRGGPAAVPSGPNSVLGLRTPPAVVPAASATVLTLPSWLPRPNNQCSTRSAFTLLQRPQADAVGFQGARPPGLALREGLGEGGQTATEQNSPSNANS